MHYDKIRHALQLYMTMINIGPLEIGSALTKQIEAKREPHNFGLTNASQQVLRYIENLHGYCDSINSLRQILKSDAMLNVIAAHENVLQLLSHDRVRPYIDQHYDWTIEISV